MARLPNEAFEEMTYDSFRLCYTKGSEVPMLKTYQEAKQELKEEQLEKVLFNLYTRENKSIFRPQKIICGKSSASTLKFGSSKQTYFLIHGWLGGKFSPVSSWVSSVKNALLEKDDCNVFIVTWGFEVSLESCFYHMAKSNARNAVGPVVAVFIRQLEEEGGLDRSSMHIIGHSLGSIAASFAGKNLQDKKVARITGLDTPDFAVKDGSESESFHPSDAVFVDEIHTLFSKFAKGHADFYPNGGQGNGLFNFYRHMKAPTYFLRSIQSGDAYPCESYAYASNLDGADVPTIDSNHMGFYATKPRGERRKYYVATSTKQD